MKREQMLLEFVGGPLDGHVQQLLATTEELIEVAAIPINHNIFLMLDGKPRGPAKPPQTMAIYELRHSPKTYYQFLQFRTPASLDADTWQV